MKRPRDRERSDHLAGFGAGAEVPVDGPAALGFERTFVLNSGRRPGQERETYFSFKDLLERLRKILKEDLRLLTDGKS